MLEYENKFQLPDTNTEIEIKIKTECLTQEEKEKTLSFMAQSSHKFYLNLANIINNTL